MTQKNMFTPTPELMQEWLTKWKDKRATVPYDEFFATQAAQWGADQELEACCEWLTTTAMTKPWDTVAQLALELRTARRLNQQSLKEQALTLVDKIQANKEMWQTDDLDIVRQALEQLND